MATTLNLSEAGASGRQGPYPLAIFFAITSLAVLLLLTPPCLSHFKNRNIGATVLCLSAIIGDLCMFLNAIIWSNDDIPNWYTGVGFCDVQIKIMGVQQVIFHASIAMILRGLAQVMNTNSSSWSMTAAKKRRNVIIDLVCCLGLPMLQMLFQWITQPFRYYILGIAGCTVPVDGSWLYILLTLGPSLAWGVVDIYYSVVLVSRLIRYRRSFNTIMLNNNTTKSRFLRLYLLSTICVVMLIPSQIYVLVSSVAPGVEKFSWNAVHHPTEYSWDSIIMVPSEGKTFYDRWIWLSGSILIFAFFGFGRDAVKTYRDLLLGVGMGRVIPSLRPGYEPARRDTVGTFSTLNSKAMLYFGKRKDSGSVTSSSATDSLRSPTLVSSTSPTFQSVTEKMGGASNKSSWLASLRGKKAFKSSNPNAPFVLTTYDRQAMIQSNISAEPHSPRDEHSRTLSNEDVMVRTEVRQASETMQPLPIGEKV